MCFSEPASFVAGGVLSATGLGTVALAVREDVRRDLALAAIPLLFGLQQIAEGFVWHALRLHMAMPGVRTRGWAMHVYLAFALVLWPAYVPIAVWLTERESRRRWLIVLLGAAGWAASADLAVALSRDVSGRVRGHSVVYSVPIGHGTVVIAGYVIATCVTCLVSSQRSVVTLGVAVTVTAILAYASWADAFVSVWCFFAAIVSVVVIAHLLRVRRAPGQSLRVVPATPG